MVKIVETIHANNDQINSGDSKEEVFWDNENLHVILTKKTLKVRFEIVTWDETLPEQDAWQSRVVTKEEAKTLCDGKWYNKLYYQKGNNIAVIDLNDKNYY